MHKFNSLVLTVMITGVFLFTGCNGQSDNQAETASKKQVASVPAEFKSGLSGVIDAYMSVKEALVLSDADAAAANSRQLETAIANVDAEMLDASQKASWQSSAAKLSAATTAFVTAADIKAQRKAFQNMTQSLVIAAENFGPFAAPLYIQFCPMAMDNEGASWISSIKEIRNPYFGDMMLNCGSIKGEIAQK